MAPDEFPYNRLVKRPDQDLPKSRSQPAEEMKANEPVAGAAVDVDADSARLTEIQRRLDETRRTRGQLGDR